MRIVLKEPMLRRKTSLWTFTLPFKIRLIYIPTSIFQGWIKKLAIHIEQKTVLLFNKQARGNKKKIKFDRWLESTIFSSIHRSKQQQHEKVTPLCICKFPTSLAVQSLCHSFIQHSLAHIIYSLWLLPLCRHISHTKRLPGFSAEALRSCTCKWWRYKQP